MNLDTVGPGAIHANQIIAVWNLILYVGAIVACMMCPIVGDRWGRRIVIGLGGVISVVGAALQAGSVNPAMLIVARFVVGAGMGILLATVPLYQTEISPPSNRGLIVGIHGKPFVIHCSAMPPALKSPIDMLYSISDWVRFDDRVLDWRRLLQRRW